jgi:hypothetical protein
MLLGVDRSFQISFADDEVKIRTDKSFDFVKAKPKPKGRHT